MGTIWNYLKDGKKLLKNNYTLSSFKLYKNKLFQRNKSIKKKNNLKKIRKINISISGIDNLKIKWKLLSIALFAGVIPIILLSYLSISSASQGIKEEIYKSNELYTELTRERIERYFFNREGDSKLIAESRIIREGIEKMNSFSLTNSEETIILQDFEHIGNIALEQYQYTDIFLTNKYKEVVFSINYEKLDMAPLVISGDYVDKAMNGRQNWSSVFRNSFINDNIIVLSTPIFGYENQDEKNPIGTLNVVLNQKEIDSIIQSGIEKLGHTADSYIIKSDGTLMSSTLDKEFSKEAVLKKKIETKALSFLKQSIDEGNLSFNETHSYLNYSNKPVIGTLSVTKIGDDYAGLLIEVDEKEALKSIKDLGIYLLIFSSIIISISIIISLILEKTISKPIIELTQTTNKIADFDLKIESKEKLSNRLDEIGNLKKATKKIVENFKNIISQVQYSSIDIMNTSNEMKEDTEISFLSITKISENMSKISKGSAEQAKDAINCFNKTTELSEILSFNEENIKEMNESINKVTEIVGEGFEIVRDLENINSKSTIANKEVQEKIINSIENSKKIEKASQIIMGIAEKTNLLALNASIEAVRAKEHGRGFAVVADEIRKLSEQSRESIQIINNIIEELKSSNNIVINKVDNLLEISEIQQKSVEKTKNKYEEIEFSISHLEDNSVKIHNSGKNINEFKIELEKMIQHLAYISEQNSESTDEVLFSLKDQSNINERISNKSNKLNELSENLKRVIKVFKYES